jgi:hypothetical protein
MKTGKQVHDMIMHHFKIYAMANYDCIPFRLNLQEMLSLSEYLRKPGCLLICYCGIDLEII